MRADEVQQDSSPEVTAGVLAAPGTNALAEHLARHMTDVVSQQLTGVRWASRVLVDGLVQPPAGTGELVGPRASACCTRTSTSYSYSYSY